LYSNVGCWHLSGKDSASNPSGMTQVYLILYMQVISIVNRKIPWSPVYC